uniref:Apple domain-containing protein n=2 Tax=Clytia hemisphaerica TaxID=252671 RepID=A0A7M6DR91_9CNID
MFYLFKFFPIIVAYTISASSLSTTTTITQGQTPGPNSGQETVSAASSQTTRYIRNAKSFSGTKIKMVAGVYMVTECVLLCEKDENCDFSVLDDMQNCTLYSTETNNKTTDQKGTLKTDDSPCVSVVFKKRSDSTTFDKASTTEFCTAKYSYETDGCYNKCGGKTGWCTYHCG